MVQIPFNVLRRYVYKEYYVDICVGSDCYEAWLYRNGYSIKLFMFGTSIYVNDLDDFVKLVESNIDSYISDYENGIERR